MGNCNFCNATSVMPYTCSLCKNKYCGKHRLPETHECVNIGVFKTEEYKKQKMIKNQSIRSISSGTYSEFPDQAQSSIFGNIKFWSTNNHLNDAMIGGVILGLIVFIELPSGFLFLLSSIIVGSLSLAFVYIIRNNVANRNQIDTKFSLWPIGIAVTLISAAIIFPLLLLGFFMNSRVNNIKSEGKTATASVLANLSVYFISYILFYYLIPEANIITLSFYLIGQLHLILAVFSIIPIGRYDGVKIMEWNGKVFWILLFLVISSYIIDITNFVF